MKIEVRSDFLEIIEYIKNKGIKDPDLRLFVSSIDENVGYFCSTSDVVGTVTMEKMLDNCLSYPDKNGVYQSS